jgi:serine/threonine-protein kinase RsbW
MKLTVTLPSEVAYVPVIRAVFSTLLDRLNVTEEDVDAVSMIVTELCSNVVRHAHSHPDMIYQVDVEYAEERVLLSVTDRGTGFDRADVPQPQEYQVGGLGLFLVERLADRVEFSPTSDGGTAVRAWLDLHHRPVSSDVAMMAS